MKTLAAAAVAALFLAACPAPGTRIYDAFLGKDKEMPCVLAYEMQDNCRLCNIAIFTMQRHLAIHHG